MTLIVEDGTGLSTAEAYTSVADADARHTAMGNTAWTGTTAAKEAALRRATQFMEQRFRSRWKGTRHTRDQALSWPRYGAEADGYALDSTSVPDDIANACADLALRALADDLNPDQTRAVIREKVGPLETEYSAHSPQATRFAAVDQALTPYLVGSGVNRPVVRA
jgi:hypothetical protein